MKPNTLSSISRRSLLGSMAVAPAAFAAAPAAAQDNGEEFKFQFTQSDEAWRDQLDDDAYFVLREGGTEVSHSSLNAFEVRDGVYACKGCDLVNFESTSKVSHFDIGWAFFSLARPDTVLLGVDTFSGMGGSGREVLECHCRRCGSHLGHLLTVKGSTLFCLNGVALNFYEA